MKTINLTELAKSDPNGIVRTLQADCRTGAVVLGIPTLLLDPQTEQASSNGNLARSLSYKAGKFFSDVRQTTNGMPATEIDYEDLALHIYGATWDECSAAASPVWRDVQWAHKSDPRYYKEPAASIVTAPHPGNYSWDGNPFIQIFPNVKTKKAPGGYDQNVLFDLVHEFEHGTGADEPQSDRAAATVNKIAFGNNAFLKSRADARVIYAVLKANEVIMGKKSFFHTGVRYP